MSRYVIAALCALLLVWGDVAYGQKKDPKRAEAERLFRAGEAAYEAAQYQAAARAFEDSYAILPLPQIAFSAAQAHRLQYFVDKETWRLMRAIELYRLYISRMDKGGRRDVAVAHLAELEPLLLRIQAATSPGQTEAPIEQRTQLMITSPIEEAVAEVAGKVEHLPSVVDVAPGFHEVTIRADGYIPVKRKIKAIEGKMVTTEVSLSPEPAIMRVGSAAEASLTIDGRPMGDLPMLEPLTLEAGTYHVIVAKRGYQPYSTEVVLGRGETLDLYAPLHRTRRRKVALVTLGTAGAMLAVTAATILYSQGVADRAGERLEKLESQGLIENEARAYSSDREDYNDIRTLSYSLFGVTVATAAAGGILYFLDNPRPPPLPRSRRESEETPKPAAKPALSIVPQLGPGAAGAAVSGRF